MSAGQASVAYKKIDGTLQVNKAKSTVSWTPQGSNKSQLEIAISEITNLQQTPPSNAKVALKIVVQGNVGHVFSFSAPANARREQEAITETLRNAITPLKTSTTQAQQNQTASDGGGQSAAMAFAQTVTASTKATESWYDDQKLKADVELQQSLFKKDTALRQRFEHSLREKPENISNSQFASQFWSARINLLRAHAVERSQSQGSYNVLAEVKPKIVDGATKLNLSKDQIALIFSQHPIVKHVYNEVVPKLSEREFWARFFVSRLFKKLKGERIAETDATDNVLDKYLNKSEESLRNQQLAEAHVSHFIDLEGNEQNHSQRQGNAPDFTMRPNEKVPILRVLNSMSEKMISRETPADDRYSSFDELRLKDLSAQDAEGCIVLNIKDQRRLFSSAGGGKGDDATAVSRTKQDPSKVLSLLREDLSKPLDLAAEPSSESARAALAQVSSRISQQRDLLSASSNNISAGVMDSLRSTHSTTVEFLHYFWTLLLAPAMTPSVRRELQSLLTTLKNSLDRISAVAAEAERERQAEVAQLKQAAADFQRKTGRKRKFDQSMVRTGGQQDVESLMGPTVRAIVAAQKRFEATAQG